jgi:hypothetical protein
MAAGAAVDGTFGSGRCVRDHRTRLDHQRLALDQAGRDGVSSPREDPRVGLPGHSHALGRGILIEPFYVGETDRFEFVRADGDRIGLARRGADRPESAAIQLAADATRNNRARHSIKSICS